MASSDLERGKEKAGRTNGDYRVDTSDNEWTSWLIPSFVVANVIVFIVVMYVNDCPKNNLGFEGGCVAKALGRFSFEPLRENPLFGPSSSA